jgi:hypothetical protein
MKPFGWYLTLIQFAIYSGYGFAESKLYRHETRRSVVIALDCCGGMCALQDSDEDVLAAGLLHCRYDGSLKRVSWLPQLSNPSHLQMLQAHSRVNWRNPNSGYVLEAYASLWQRLYFREEVWVY